jgi:hypothetical protein
VFSLLHLYMTGSKRKREEHEDSGLQLSHNHTPAGKHSATVHTDQTRAKRLHSLCSTTADDALDELKALLDLSTLTDTGHILARFDEIADVLLNQILLRLSVPPESGEADAQASSASVVTDFAILELEFYLYKSGCHEDPFTHGTEEQRVSGRW